MAEQGLTQGRHAQLARLIREDEVAVLEPCHLTVFGSRELPQDDLLRHPQRGEGFEGAPALVHEAVAFAPVLEVDLREQLFVDDEGLFVFGECARETLRLGVPEGSERSGIRTALRDRVPCQTLEAFRLQRLLRAIRRGDRVQNLASVRGEPEIVFRDGGRCGLQ